MNRDQLDFLKELQALEFTGFDLVLYLDTHPGDQKALADYTKAICETEHLRNMYVAKYGPLTTNDSVNQPCWRWIEEPWPWEIEY